METFPRIPLLESPANPVEEKWVATYASAPWRLRKQVLVFSASSTGRDETACKGVGRRVMAG